MVIVVLVHAIVALLGLMSVSSSVFADTIWKGISRLILGVILIILSGSSFFYFLSLLKR